MSGTREIAGSAQTGVASLTTGDVSIILNPPPDAHVGCDTMSISVLNTTSKLIEGHGFIGIRSISPGAHFVWLSSPSAMTRQGYWFIAKPASHVCHVKQWDSYNEVLDECTSRSEVCSVLSGLASVSHLLLPYNSSSLKMAPGYQPPQGQRLSASGPESAASAARIWMGLTSCVTESVLNRITGKTPATDNSAECLLSTADSAKGEVALTTAGETAGYTELTFLFAKDDLDPFQLLASRSQSTNGQQHVLCNSGVDVCGDTSDTTEKIIAQLSHSAGHIRGSDLIGELQFAFITGMLLSNLSCLEQWWHLVLKVFLRAWGLISWRPSLCCAFIQTLHHQFTYLDRYVSGGFLRQSSSSLAQERHQSGTSIFDAKPWGEYHLRAALAIFGRRLNETLAKLGDAASPEQVLVGEEFASLEASLWKNGWDLRDEADRGGASRRANEDGDEDEGEVVDYYDETARQPTQQVGSSVPLRLPATVARPHTLSDTDSDSDQPVLVDLDENGREVGLVSWG